MRNRCGGEFTARRRSMLPRSSFGVIGSLVGAFFGIKIGTQNAMEAMDHAERMMNKYK